MSIAGDTTNKPKVLEDCWWWDNICFDGIEEWDEESWADTEQNLKDILGKILGIQNIKIKKSQYVRDKNDHRVEQYWWN